MYNDDWQLVGERIPKIIGMLTEIATVCVVSVHVNIELVVMMDMHPKKILDDYAVGCQYVASVCKRRTKHRPLYVNNFLYCMIY